MKNDNNPFVQRQLAQLSDFEHELIRLYAESCYSDIQAAHGNRSCMERVGQLHDALRLASARLRRQRARLRRLGVPRSAMPVLDARQRVALFEAIFRSHDAAFTAPCGQLDQQLNALLEANVEVGKNGIQAGA